MISTSPRRSFGKSFRRTRRTKRSALAVSNMVVSTTQPVSRIAPIKVNFLCRDSILAAPIVLDLALFMDFAHRAGMHGVQEWLSFYWKSPMTPDGLYPEHDLFIQLMKLKNTLRHMRGEELITHLGAEYYD